MLFRFFENAVDVFPAHQNDVPPKKMRAFILHYAKPFKWMFIASTVASILLALIEVAAFELVGSIVDWAVVGPEAFWEVHGGKILAIVILFAVVWPLTTLFDDLIMLQGILGNMAMQVRWRAHRHLLRQSSQFFSNDFAGRLATKVMQTALGTRDALITLTNIFAYMAVYLITMIILFAGNDIRLAIPLILWIGAYALVLRHFLPRLRDWSEKQSDARSLLTGRVVDAYTNIGTVKAFGSVDAEEAYAKSAMKEMLSVVYGSMRLNTLMSFCMHVINGLFVASIVALGTWLWTRGEMTIGALAFAGTIALRMQGQAHWFLWEAVRLFEHIGAVEDGIGSLAKPISVTDPKGAETLEVTKGEIRFDQVSFNYGQNKAVIHDLNLTIAPGERVGLVGPSGAGKSTLMSLLMRLYDVEAGKIAIDGQDVSTVGQESLRQQIGLVAQDTSLLHRSIRDNIAYGRPDASDEEIIEAAKRAEAWDFVQDLEDAKGRRGLDAHVGDRGVKLSGGQRQRIAIARVLLKDAPILVLDEATSALDSEVEAAIQAQLDELMADKTVLAIAHRLSTIAAMDRLVVMEAGQIVEQGTHQELVAFGGVYARLWSRQSGGFLAEQESEAAPNEA